jgi:hypothetical protein
MVTAAGLFVLAGAKMQPVYHQQIIIYFKVRASSATAAILLSRLANLFTTITRLFSSMQAPVLKLPFSYLTR